MDFLYHNIQTHLGYDFALGFPHKLLLSLRIPRQIHVSHQKRKMQFLNSTTTKLINSNLIHFFLSCHFPLANYRMLRKKNECKDATYWSPQAPFHSLSFPHGFRTRTNSTSIVPDLVLAFT